MTPEYIKALIIFFVGLIAFVLFMWYFAAEEARKKRLLGTVLTVVLTGFSIFTLLSEKLKKGIDLEGGAAFRVQVVPAEGRTVTKMEAEAAKEIIERRLAPLGNKDLIATVQGEDIIYVEVPGISPEEIENNRKIIETVAKLEFRLVHPESDQLIAARAPEESVIEPGYDELINQDREAKEEETADKAAKKLNTEDAKLHRDEQAKKREEKLRKEKHTIVVKHTPEMSGKSVKNAFVSMRPGTASYQINVKLRSEYGDQMLALTKKNIGKPMAIVVDGEVISAPRINGEFGDSFEVTGNFTEKQARDLASALSNPLENPLKIIQSSQTSPTFGESVIRQGLFAGVAGLVFTLIFMAIYYRLAGIIAVIALLVNTLILLAAMIIFDFTLTMPGIAGMLLTLGIAIDANVLIYERMREEFATGKSFKAAIEASYNKAFTAIFDSHVTSLITSILMIGLATGAVKGFGVTLTVGIAASLFSAVLITRVCFSWLDSFGLKKLTFLHLISNRYIDFMSKRRIFVTASVILSIVAIAALAIKGKKALGYELRGGDLVSLTGATEEKVVESLADVKALTLPDGTKETFSYTIQTIKPLGEELEYVNVRTNANLGGFAKAEILKDIPTVKITDEQHIGPAVGDEMLKDSILAIVFGLLGIFIYLTFRYEVPFAIGGIISLTHDVIMAAGVCAIFGREIGMILIGALLTIAGYSINDTIVIFDRIRDNLRTSKADLATVMNEAISATLSRTILTAGVTLIVVLAMFFFGGPSMNDFSFTMLIGIVVGCYSSIFVASPIVLWWAKKHKLNLQKSILDADQMRLEAMSGMEKEVPEAPVKGLPSPSK